MSTSWEWHHTTHNPTGLASAVGGDITGALLQGNLNELFAYISAPPSGSSAGIEQYRKIHVKNISSFTLTGVRLWLDAVEHSGQIDIGIEELNATQTISDATGAAPTSVLFGRPIDFNSGTGIGTSSFPPNHSTGVWIRQTLTGVDEPDPYASLRLTVGGIDSSSTDGV